MPPPIGGKAGVGVGAIVAVKGLRAQKEYNDDVGQIVGWDEEQSRWMVEVASDGNVLVLLDKNMNVLEPAPEAEPPAAW